MMNSDALAELQAAQPAWMVDGLGVRGTPHLVERRDLPDFPRASFEQIGGDEPDLELRTDLPATSAPATPTLGQLQTYKVSGTTVGVTNGQIYNGGSHTPTIGGTPLSNDPPPTMDVAGASLVILQLNLNSDGIGTSAQISAGTILPENSDTAFYIPLATLAFDDGDVVPSPQVAGSLAHELCGGVDHICGAL